MLLPDPADHLLGAASATILRTLHGIPAGLTEVDLAARAGQPTDALSPVLERLAGIGIIEYVAAKREAVYRLRTDHPVWAPTAKLIAADRDAVSTIRLLITQLGPEVVTVAVLPDDARKPRTNPTLRMVIVQPSDHPGDARDHLSDALRKHVRGQHLVDTVIESMTAHELEVRIRQRDPETLDWKKAETIYGRDLAAWASDLKRADE